MKKTVDIYVRVSRVAGRGGDKFISPADQEKAARSFAKHRGLMVGEVLTDLDKSGGSLDRPGLKRAVDRVRSRESSGIVVAWLDRLSRDSEQGTRLLRELDEAGGKVWAPEMPEDMASPEGELQVGMFLLIAQYQRKRARKGLESAKRGAIERGIPINSRAPVGYLKGDDRRMLPDPETAAHVLRAFEMRAEGRGPTEIAEMLEEAGVRTSQGSALWTKPSIYNLLKSRVYLGELSYGLDRRFVNLEAHEPIVDPATWAAAQAKRTMTKQAKRREDGGFLVGVARCAGCGYSMQHTFSSRDKRLYRCTVRHAAGRCPSPARVDADLAEEAAERLLRVATEGLGVRGRAGKPSVDLSPIRGELELLERRLSQAESPEAQDAFGDRWLEVVKRRREERDAKLAELGALEADARGESTLIPVFALWHGASPAMRRELLARVFDVLAVTPDGELHPFPRGTGPAELPTRGYRRDPQLKPIDAETREAARRRPRSR
jgi:site-specific DNA recombinase